MSFGKIGQFSGLSKSDYFRIEIPGRCIMFLHGFGQNQTILGLKLELGVDPNKLFVRQNQTILGLKYI